MIAVNGCSLYRSIVPETFLVLVEKVTNQAETGSSYYEYSYEVEPGKYSLRQHFDPTMSKYLRKISCLQNNRELNNETLFLFKSIGIGHHLTIHRLSMFIKQPSSALRLGFHQDIGVEWPSSKCEGLRVAWIPLQDTDSKNGSLSFIPFSHLKGIIGNGNHISPDQIDDLNTEVTIEASRGDMALFDPRLVHRSGSNTTGAKRYALNILFSSQLP